MRDNLDPFHLYVLLVTAGLLLLFGLPRITAFIKDSASVDAGSKSSKNSSTKTSPTVAENIPQDNSVADEPSVSPRTEKDFTSQQDKDAYQVYYWNLPILISAYSARSGYPIANAQGWRVFLDSLRTPIIDPHTNKEPVFTTQTPKVGEIQYISPGSCERGAPELKVISTKNSYAFRSFVAGKMMCSGNLTGYVD